MKRFNSGQKKRWGGNNLPGIHGSPLLTLGCDQNFKLNVLLVIVYAYRL